MSVKKYLPLLTLSHIFIEQMCLKICLSTNEYIKDRIFELLR